MSGFSRSRQVGFFDWDGYEKYEVALFMTYDQDIKELVAAKKKNPNLKVGLIDPRGSRVIDCLPFVDFLIVDSLEMKDFFAGTGLPILLYAEYPDIKNISKQHENGEKIRIGYHGNKLHLAGMYPYVSSALEKLGEKYPIELWAMYNIRGLGKCRLGLPCNIPVRHIQWDMENYGAILSKTDIGIVPNLMPIRNIDKIKAKASLLKKFFNDSNDDYLVRYKMPSNPGRIIVFGKLGIPVVTDFYPSAFQIIQDGVNGNLVCSPGGWYAALKDLIENPGRRQIFAENLKQTINKKYDYDIQNQNALIFFKQLLEGNVRKDDTPYGIEKKVCCQRDLKFWSSVARMEVDKWKYGLGTLGRKIGIR